MNIKPYIKTALLLIAFLAISQFAFSASMEIPAGAEANINSATVTGLDSVTNNGTITMTTGSITVSGDWNNNGTFNPGSSKVVFNDSLQTSHINGNTTFYDFECITPNKQFQFEAGSTQIIGGSLFLDGGQDADSEILLHSSILGTRWMFDVVNSGQTVNAVDIQDSEVLTNDLEASNVIDSGNNDNGEGSPEWKFIGLAPEIGRIVLIVDNQETFGIALGETGLIRFNETNNANDIVQAYAKIYSPTTGYDSGEIYITANEAGYYTAPFHPIAIEPATGQAPIFLD
jgi:hypothetical protein